MQALNSATANAENKNDLEEENDETKDGTQDNEEANAEIADDGDKRFVRSPLVLSQIVFKRRHRLRVWRRHLKNHLTLTKIII